MFLTAYRKRTCTVTVTVTQSDGSAVTFASGDVMRVKIGRAGHAPILDLDSANATSNGSSVSAANPTTLRLDQDDLDITPGVYDIEVAIVDDSDSDAIKHGELGVFNLLDVPLGDIGLT